jgi:hypothetical protein
MNLDYEYVPIGLIILDILSAWFFIGLGVYIGYCIWGKEEKS